jgi:hypothetical protein
MAHWDHFRAHGRVLVHIDAVLRQQDARVLPVTIRDIGFGGAGIEVTEPPLQSTPQPASPSVELVPDLPVVIELVAPVLWDPLYLQGTIAWSQQISMRPRTSRAGIRFVELGPTTLLSLFDVLTTH